MFIMQILLIVISFFSGTVLYSLIQSLFKQVSINLNIFIKLICVFYFSSDKYRLLILPFQTPSISQLVYCGLVLVIWFC